MLVSSLIILSHEERAEELTNSMGSVLLAGYSSHLTVRRISHGKLLRVCR